ncbi:hypothetical protein LP420_15500 [Massilia sp. B-10]|nr:hypothetical protein LP420_15500 [Massilia sp. B-10]
MYSAATCTAIGTIPAYNLNLASMTAANVLGSLTLTLYRDQRGHHHRDLQRHGQPARLHGRRAAA